MSLLTSVIPLPYRVLAGVVLFGALTIGCYAWGRHDGNLQSKVAIAQYTAKHDKQVSDLLGIQTITNTKIVEKVITKTVTIHDQGIQNAQIASTVVPDHQLLSVGWLYIHDIAAIGDTADATRASDGTSSGVTANQALVTVVNNYATCRQTAAELNGLQDWINQTNANITKANKNQK
jgi:hypothetical protein